MRNILLFIILVFTAQFSHSQTAKKLTGAVVYNDFALLGIEVINLDSKQTTATNDLGSFTIFAKVGDQLMFLSKSYEYKTITLKEADFLNPNFVISLVKKPEELDEVVVTRAIKAPKIADMQRLLDTKIADDKYSQQKNPLIKDATIPNGANPLRILGMILSIFIKEKEKEKTKKVSEVNFKKLVNSTLDLDFFKKALDLKPEEVALFLEFCDADIKSKKIIENPNELALREFLNSKNNEFKKLPKAN